MNSDKESDALRSTMKSKSDSISCENRTEKERERASARANAKTYRINKSYCHWDKQPSLFSFIPLEWIELNGDDGDGGSDGWGWAHILQNKYWINYDFRTFYAFTPINSDNSTSIWFIPFVFSLLSRARCVHKTWIRLSCNAVFIAKLFANAKASHGYISFIGCVKVWSPIIKHCSVHSITIFKRSKFVWTESSNPFFRMTSTSWFFEWNKIRKKFTF